MTDIERGKGKWDKLQRLDYVKIPSGFDFYVSLCDLYRSEAEARQGQPETIGQASRIPVCLRIGYQCFMIILMSR